MNKDKPATNTEACVEDATILEEIQSYKYLGITGTPNSSISEESIKKV